MPLYKARTISSNGLHRTSFAVDEYFVKKTRRRITVPPVSSVLSSLNDPGSNEYRTKVIIWRGINHLGGKNKYKAEFIHYLLSQLSQWKTIAGLRFVLEGGIKDDEGDEFSRFLCRIVGEEEFNLSGLTNLDQLWERQMASLTAGLIKSQIKYCWGNYLRGPFRLVIEYKRHDRLTCYCLFCKSRDGVEINY